MGIAQVHGYRLSGDANISVGTQELYCCDDRIHRSETAKSRGACDSVYLCGRQVSGCHGGVKYRWQYRIDKYSTLGEIDRGGLNQPAERCFRHDVRKLVLARNA